MKKFIKGTIMTICLVGMLMQTGCYGSFELTKKVYDWNGSIEDKFVRSIVFFALCVIPVYPLAAFVDAVFLNLIEFWSGSNPISMKDGDHEEQIVYHKGKTYKIEAVKNRFIITDLSTRKAKPPVNFVFTPENMTWNLEKDNHLIALSRLEKDAEGNVCVRVFEKGGKSSVTALSEENIAWNTFVRNLHLNLEATAQR
jgi:hypothetical protein